MTEEKNIVDNSNVRWGEFLKDVIICSLGAYGGPEAHFGVFMQQLVVKKNYLTEDEITELMALMIILPGPSSTQTIVSIGYKIGGPMLGFLTMIVWGLPAIAIMTALSFLSQFLISRNISQDGLRYIGPMAVGFIIVAAVRIGRKVLVDKVTIFLMLFSALATYFIRATWIFPLVLVLGGVLSVVTTGEKNLWNRISLNPPWKYLIAFLIFAIGALTFNFIFDNRLISLFESFYRYGYLVIGGGQVVVPLMYSEMVEVNHYLISQEFLTGYGIVQGIPGPMFSFSAYAGGMASQGINVFYQILGALISGVAIFLPGILLIYFFYPIWEEVKMIRGIKVSLRGITAVASGLIITAAVILMQNSGFRIDNFIVMSITIVLLYSKKIPSPLIVLLAIVAGFIV